MLNEIVINPKIAYNKMGDNYFILNNQGKLITVNNIGIEIWEKLLEGYSTTEITNYIKNIYCEVNIEVINKDIEDFLQELLENTIILDKKQIKNSNKYIKPGKYVDLWIEAGNNNIPLKVDIEVTNTCNLRCKYCYVELEKSKKKVFLSKETLKSLFDELKEQGTLFVTITGGEALLHPDIFEILEYAVNKKFCVRLLTNGTTLDDRKLKIIDDIASKGLLELDVSIHSLDENKFDEFTQQPGSFKNFINTINNHKKYNFPIALVYNITKYNVEEIENIRDFSEKNNCYLIINPIIYPTLHTNNSNVEHYMNKDSIKYLIENNILNPKPIACFATKAKCWIDFNGDVNICEFIRFSAGNIQNSSFIKIWSDLSNKEIYKNMIHLDKQCNECEKKDKCCICPGLALLSKNKEYFCNIANMSNVLGGNIDV